MPTQPLHRAGALIVDDDRPLSQRRSATRRIAEDAFAAPRSIGL
ncbi:hypothetical protein ACH4OY_05545 [Micromonospora rubida]|uniref:TetR family transcriptional regulator n=1 Tax=Micromonospora rubida TaxID=2697657 RepID=A0ABW7SEQ2_9ACTN